MRLHGHGIPRRIARSCVCLMRMMMSVCVADINDNTVFDIDEFVRIGRTKWLQPTDQWVAPPEPR